MPFSQIRLKFFLLGHSPESLTDRCTLLSRLPFLSQTNNPLQLLIKTQSPCLVSILPLLPLLNLYSLPIIPSKCRCIHHKETLLDHLPLLLQERQLLQSQWECLILV